MLAVARPVILILQVGAAMRKDFSGSPTSLKSKLPQGRSNASATKKSNRSLSSSGASSNGSNVSHGEASFISRDKATVSGNCTLPTKPSLTTNHNFDSSPKTIRPVTLNDSPFPRKEALIGAFAASHFRNRDMASSRDELIFLRAAVSLGFTRAADLAAIHHWKCQRPLQALLAVLNESDRNCNVQSAKRKPLSGSSASSRKRS